MRMTPRVLLVATSRWFSTARLAKALLDVGSEIAVVGPRGHPVTTMRAAVPLYRYRPLAPLSSIRIALEAAKPDFIIPCDDLATDHLHALYVKAARLGDAARARGDVLGTCLGDCLQAPPPKARAALIKLASEEGIRVPPTDVVEAPEDLSRWFARNGGPAVLKTDGSYGGRGVRIVNSLTEARGAWRTLRTPPSVRRAVKRAIVNGDGTYVLPCVRRTRAVVNVQRFVPGQDANCTVACWKGKVLSCVTARVLHTLDPIGPASMVQLIDNREMSEAVEAIVRRLRISGLIGFDFILEEQTESAFLIEMNPRATQMSHLPLGAGRDLAASLYAALSGEPVRERPSVTEGKCIALFPQEWLRDPTSEFLKTAFHDVPWDEPDLVRASVQDPLARRMYAQTSAKLLSMKARLFGRVGPRVTLRGSLPPKWPDSDLGRERADNRPR